MTLRRLLGRRGGLLPRRSYLALVVGISLLTPVVVLRGFLFHPFERIVSPRPYPNDVDGDPLVAVGVLGRSWERWDAGDLARHDDRVFAPYPDVWGIAESSTMIAVAGYPFYLSTGSFAFGYDAAYFIACVGTGLSAGLFFGRLVGQGWPALLGTLLFLWSPGRLNNLGAIQTLWAGLNLLPLAAILRFRRTRSWRDTVAAAAGFLLVSLGTLYGSLMGAVVLALASAAISRPLWREPRALARLAAPFLAAGGALAWFYAPLFAIDREFEIRPGLRNIEGHAADLLSFLHHGVFSGPLRTVCDRLVPGLPDGSSALFPTLFLVVVLVGTAALPVGAARVRQHHPDRRAGIWLLLAAIVATFALGPKPRLAGTPIGIPGPYALLANLPAFSTMRGIHRWDQWFGLMAISAAVVLAARLLSRRGPAVRAPLVALLGVVALVDVWPRYVPGQVLPGPSPFQKLLEATPPDTVIGIYPIRHYLSERAWVEQLHHGRRLVNGFNSFPPPLHAWLDELNRVAPPKVVFAAYREMGAGVIDVHLSELDRDRRADVEALLGELSRDGEVVLRSGDRCLVAFRQLREPIVVVPGRVRGLVFLDGKAEVARAPGRLLLRLSGGELRVRIRHAGLLRDGGLRFPLVATESMTAEISPAPPPGAVIESENGDVLGVVR